jgi:hypothetical protein
LRHVWSGSVFVGGGGDDDDDNGKKLFQLPWWKVFSSLSLSAATALLSLLLFSKWEATTYLSCLVTQTAETDGMKLPNATVSNKHFVLFVQQVKMLLSTFFPFCPRRWLLLGRKAALYSAPAVQNKVCAFFGLMEIHTGKDSWLQQQQQVVRREGRGEGGRGKQV